MCLTKKKKIFSWGCGVNGRLGHNDEDEILEPKEIIMLSNLRIASISAGDSHSAAVS